MNIRFTGTELSARSRYRLGARSRTDGNETTVVVSFLLARGKNVTYSTSVADDIGDSPFTTQKSQESQSRTGSDK